MATMSFCAKMHLEHEWKYYELLWESPQHKEEAIKSGKYNVSAAFFYDVDKADGKLTLFKDSNFFIKIWILFTRKLTSMVLNVIMLQIYCNIL